MTSLAAGPTTVAHRAPGHVSVRDVLAQPDRLHLVFQPIVDVARGAVAGYEALSRFSDADGTPSRATPDVWFAEADRQGVGAELEAVALTRALDARRDLPPNCFLTVNVSPHLLTHPAMTGPLLAAGPLSTLVLELTEHHSVADLRPLLALRDELQARGAAIALDDAGSGYSGLQQLIQIRPQIIKLDRSLVADADTDEAKLALAELLGLFGSRIDAWLLAEGVETWAELEAFQRLGVPLAQGYLLGRPAPSWLDLEPATAARLRDGAARMHLRENLAGIYEPVSTRRSPAVPARSRRTAAPEPPGPDTDRPVVLVDEFEHPVGLRLPQPRNGRGREVVDAPVSLRAPLSSSVSEIARRAMSRPPGQRFDPVVVVDNLGAVIGIVRIERIVGALATT